MATISLSISKKFGLILLGIWLIVMGLTQAKVFTLSSPWDVIMGIFAIIAGIVVILDL